MQSMERIEVKDNGLEGLFFTNRFREKQKAILILGGSEGGIPFSSPKSEAWMKELVLTGCAVLCLGYCGVGKLPSTLERIPLSYFEQAFDWLAGQPGIDPGQYALIGGTKGGELALLLASRYAQVCATVAVLPSSVVFQGIPKLIPSVVARKSSWTCQGQDLPFVPFPLSFSTVMDLLSFKTRRLYEKSLENSEAVAKATIPVEQSQGPILLISACQDEFWPSTPMCEQVMERLDARHFKPYHQHISYQSGHNVFQAKGCWPAIVDFVKGHFAQPSSLK